MTERGIKPPRVLVVDDEVQIRRLLRRCLERQGYEIVEAATAEQGIDQAIRTQPHLVLLDLGLPDTDGLEVLQRIREWSAVPIMVVSGRAGEEEKVKALDAGANDYITKPFGTEELLARLRVAQRYCPQHTDGLFRSGDLRVDLPARAVSVRGQDVHLTATEYSLLHLLIRHAGKILTHGQLLREIWGARDEQNTGPLRVYIGYLREKLEADPAQPKLLLTEPGVGYRLAVLG
jgi:two-component system, OmpR family, KDP operon response regulator KdpE